MKIDLHEALSEVGAAATAEAKKQGFNIKEDTFTVVQQFGDHQAIIFKVEEDDEGKRAIKYEVTDSVMVLPKREKLIDIFEEDEEQ